MEDLAIFITKLLDKYIFYTNFSVFFNFLKRFLTSIHAVNFFKISKQKIIQSSTSGRNIKNSMHFFRKTPCKFFKLKSQEVYFLKVNQFCCAVQLINIIFVLLIFSFIYCFFLFPITKIIQCKFCRNLTRLFNFLSIYVF